MKKIIALLLIAILAISLVACGNNNTTDPENKNDPAQSQGNENNNSKTDNGNSGKTDNGNSGKTDALDLSTEEGYLAKFNYTVDDFKFTKDFSRIGYTVRMALASDAYEITEIGVFQSAKKTTEEKQAWLEAFVNLMKTKSDDGKVYKYGIVAGMSSEEYVAQFDPDAYTFLTRMAYKMNGKVVTVVVTVGNGLDNEDHDMANPFTTIEFEFEKTY